ncbi:hypothetical protein [Bombilactobacillus mellis]|uniref:hypothetical protein n=1 Tax=Bombilactobacillus mellis TaxID=1218508 RepID=UPI00157FC4AB|nr:hypothetical protein [Bombilactobacillus mellis]NUF24865.1 hypothetical protein [Bombilactobacillus mellis]
MMNKSYSWLLHQDSNTVTNKIRQFITLDNYIENNDNSKFYSFYNNLGKNEREKIDPSVLIFSKNPNHFQYMIDDLKVEFNKLSEDKKNIPIIKYLFTKLGILKLEDLNVSKIDASEFISIKKNNSYLLYKLLLFVHLIKESDSAYLNDVIPLVEGMGVYYAQEYQLENTLIICYILSRLEVNDSNLDSLKNFLSLQVRENGAIGYINPLNNEKLTHNKLINDFFIPNTFYYLNIQYIGI